MAALKKLSDTEIQDIWGYITSLANEDGSFTPSLEPGYLGIADSAVCDFSAAVYAAELAMTLGLELPYPQQTADFIRGRQSRDGYFDSVTITAHKGHKGILVYKTCMGLRGLRALGQTPTYDPRDFLVDYVRTTENDKFTPYVPCMTANCYVTLDDWMPADCEAKLAEFLLDAQDPNTGWVVQKGLAERGLPFQRNNPKTFHAARFFCLAGKRIPMGEKILQQFMDFQEDDGSWKLGYVHGTFDACVAIRILSDNSEPYLQAVQRAAAWVPSCQQADKGFNHFNDGKSAEIDACYFQIATLVMAGWIPTPLTSDNRWIGWGHTLINDGSTG